jgi:TPR repeat protein
MPNVNFTCPHCSHTTELASSTEGMKGNCPSCKAEVVITPDIPEPSIVPTANKPSGEVQKVIWKQPVVIGISLVGVIGVVVLFISLMFSGGAESVVSNSKPAVNSPIIPTSEPDPEPSATKMSAEDQFNLGNKYRKGDGVPQDYKEAVKWYSLAAARGFAFAQHHLGDMYAMGSGVPQDYNEAMKLYRLAAEQGLDYAQYTLGASYAKGQVVPQDFEEAATWYRLAAEQGNEHAQMNLGRMYQTGSGVSQDYAEAIKLYRLAAEQGLAHAQYVLGEMYWFGTGVPENYKEGLKWHRSAAEQKHADAQFALGGAYLVGKGVPRNPTEAYIWFSVAGANVVNRDSKRSQHIKEGLEFAKNDLTPEQLAEAQEEATARFKQIKEKQ